jgi:toxin ParE1/3/4
MKVVITESAQTDLDEIPDYIAADNPGRAFSFIDELMNRCHELGDFPEAYPLVPRYEHQGFRRRVYGNYLIFYRVRSDRVEVLRLVHGARDYESLLFEGE